VNKDLVHLHYHSNYSAKDSINNIKDSIAKIKADEQTAIAITDHASIGGTLDFYDECKSQGIKPIIGCEVYMRCDEKLTDNPQERYHLILLCKNLTGWKNLIKIVKQSHVDAYYVPLATWESIEANKEGLIATTACFAGPVASPIIHDRYDLAESNLKRLINIFGEDLYVEFQPNSLDNQVKINTALYQLCKKYNVKYTIGVDAHYINKEDSLSQETLLGINMDAQITDKPKHMDTTDEIIEDDKDKEENLQEEFKDNKKGKPKEKRRFSFEKHDFWLMNEEDLYKMWDANHKLIGQNDEQGEAPHIIVLMKAIENGKEIVNKIEDFDIYPDKTKLVPKFNISDEDKNDPKFIQFLERDINNEHALTLKFLRFLLEKGFYEKGIDKKQNVKEYLNRIINVELPDTITADIVDYFLVIWDLAKYCRQENIMTGTSRGSFSGSLIGYLIDVHTVDPIEHELIWERFYNAGRIGSMPDVDVDYSTESRFKVFEYLLNKYGFENVSMISNYAFYKPKSTFRAVCTFYGIKYQDISDAIKGIKHIDVEENEDKLNNFEKDYDIDFNDIQKQMVTLLEAKKVQNLLENNPYKEKIIRDCLKIVSSVSNKSVHASGIVITREPIISLCPMINKKKSKEKNKDIIGQATEWDMRMLDRAGFLKLDILGLKTLDIIKNTLELADKTDLDWKHLPTDDSKVLNLFTIGNTSGVFQFDYGSELQRLCLEFKPKTFNDICVLTSLGRPGAKSFLEQYMINRSKADHEIELLDPKLKPILKATNFVLAYQEQQMAICKDLAGFTLKEADDLRKIVAKKKVDKIPAMMEKFIKGCIDQGIVEETGQKIWDAYFSDCGYLFNKSHAVSYSLLSYATAYLKHYYTVPFMTAVLNNSNDGKREDFADYVYETMRMDITVLKPHIRYSNNNCTVKDNKCIIGLNTIKDLSETNADKIQAHNQNDESLINYLFSMPKKTYEAIILSGAADGLCGLNRRSLFQSVELYKSIRDEWKEYENKVKTYKQSIADQEAKGKKSRAKPPEEPKIKLMPATEFQKIIVDEYSVKELMLQELDYLGYSPSDPDFGYLPFILNETLCKSKDKDSLKDRQTCYIYGTIDDVRVRKDKNENEMATIQVKPKTSPYSFYITVFSSVYEKDKFKLGLKIGKAFVFKCEVNEYMSTKTEKLVKSFNLKDFKEAKEVWKKAKENQ
jgi:DNA polymerase-3 subunit alpha